MGARVRLLFVDKEIYTKGLLQHCSSLGLAIGFEPAYVYSIYALTVLACMIGVDSWLRKLVRC